MNNKKRIQKLKKFANLLGASVRYVYVKNFENLGELISYNDNKHVIMIYYNKNITQKMIMFTLLHEISHLMSAKLKTKDYQKVVALLEKMYNSDFTHFSINEQKKILKYEKSDFRWWFLVNELLDLKLSIKDIKKAQKEDEKAFLEIIKYGKKERKKSRRILQRDNKKSGKKNKRAGA